MIEKLEIKINKWKKKINKKALGVGIFMIFGAISIFAMEMTNNFKRQKQSTEDEYNKSLYEIVGYVRNVEVELAKLQLTNTPRLTTTTLANIWKQANLAKENLEALPIEQNTMAGASKYLTQVSDYSYSLLKQVSSGDKITQEEYTQIAKIHEESSELSDVMENIYTDLNTGRIRWDEIREVGNRELADKDISETVSNVEKIGKTFQDYEGLIYDGAFSDHMLSEEPKGTGEEEVSAAQAEARLHEIFTDKGEDRIESLERKEDSEGRIELYQFDVKLKDEESIKHISMTKKGGKIYLMLSDRKVKEANLEMAEAKQKGLEFLKKIGIENVKDTYYLTTENMAIINYAAVQDDVMLYPDLIKVKVALDDGEICSVESQGYLFNHQKRENLKPKISMEKAKQALNTNIQVQTEKLAVIPTDSRSEVLTYEFKGKIEEREFLIYINAQTGEEEKILLILETPGGVLTM